MMRLEPCKHDYGNKEILTNSMRWAILIGISIVLMITLAYTYWLTGDNNHLLYVQSVLDVGIMWYLGWTFRIENPF